MHVLLGRCTVSPLGTPYILANFLRVVSDGRFRGFSSFFFNGHLIHPVGDFLFFSFFFRSLSRIGIWVVDDRQLSILYTLLH